MTATFACRPFLSLCCTCALPVKVDSYPWVRLCTRAVGARAARRRMPDRCDAGALTGVGDGYGARFEGRGAGRRRAEGLLRGRGHTECAECRGGGGVAGEADGEGGVAGAAGGLDASAVRLVDRGDDGEAQAGAAGGAGTRAVAAGEPFED